MQKSKFDPYTVSHTSVLMALYQNNTLKRSEFYQIFSWSRPNRKQFNQEM
jgi:hypothetical protein